MGFHHVVVSPSSRGDSLDISSLTEDLSPDIGADFLVTHDSSDGSLKKVLLSNVPSSGGDSFTIVQADSGTSPTADSSTDTLTLTSSDASIEIEGNSTTDTIDFKENKNDKSFSSSAVDKVGVTISAIPSQTASFIEYKNSSGTKVAGIDIDGTFRMKQGSSQTDAAIRSIGGTNHGIVLYNSGSNAQVNVLAGTSARYDFTKNGLTCWSTGSQYGVRSDPNGSVNIAAFAFRPDGDTGMYRIAANNLGFTAGSTKVLDMKSDRVLCPVLFSPGHYSTASLPAASSYEGYIAYDTDTKTMKWSNGTSWATI